MTRFLAMLHHFRLAFEAAVAVLAEELAAVQIDELPRLVHGLGELLHLLEGAVVVRHEDGRLGNLKVPVFAQAHWVVVRAVVNDEYAAGKVHVHAVPVRPDRLNVECHDFNLKQAGENAQLDRPAPSLVVLNPNAVQVGSFFQHRFCVLFRIVTDRVCDSCPQFFSFVVLGCVEISVVHAVVNAVEKTGVVGWHRVFPHGDARHGRVLRFVRCDFHRRLLLVGFHNFEHVSRANLHFGEGLHGVGEVEGGGRVSHGDLLRGRANPAQLANHLHQLVEGGAAVQRHYVVRLAVRVSASQSKVGHVEGSVFDKTTCKAYITA